MIHPISPAKTFRPVTWAALISQTANLYKIDGYTYRSKQMTTDEAAMYLMIQNWTIEYAKIKMQEGSYGFYRVWINIGNLLSKAKIQEASAALVTLQRQRVITD